MSSFQRKLAHCTQCNIHLNRRILCMKRSWDEVAMILRYITRRKGCCR